MIPAAELSLNWNGAELVFWWLNICLIKNLVCAESASTAEPLSRVDLRSDLIIICWKKTYRVCVWECFRLIHRIYVECLTFPFACVCIRANEWLNAFYKQLENSTKTNNKLADHYWANQRTHSRHFCSDNDVDNFDKIVFTKLSSSSSSISKYRTRILFSIAAGHVRYIRFLVRSFCHARVRAFSSHTK